MPSFGHYGRHVAPVSALSPFRIVLKVVNTFVGVALVTACLTVLFLCMRAVMDVGGACGSGGPYVIAVECPSGIGWLMPLSIFGGLASVGWLVFWNAGLPGPKVAMLVWSALFLSLGWNFWEYGLDPPGDGGTEVGWIICGVVFALMGGAPLLGLLSKTTRRSAFWSDGRAAPTDPDDSSPFTAKRYQRSAALRIPTTMATKNLWEAVAAATAQASTAQASTAPTDRPDSDDVSTELERLAALHRSGALTDDEFAAAKRRVLGI